MTTEIPTAVKIVAIVIVATWACVGAIRLLYPAVWKWMVQKIAIIWRPCIFCFHYLCPERSIESKSLKHHYVLPINFSNGERDSFSKSFTENGPTADGNVAANGKKRKSEGSLKLERRKTELNVAIPNVPSSDMNNTDIETPTSSQQYETRTRSQSKTKKEGRRRGQEWVRGGAGRGIRGRGRFARESGFDYPFEQPNYDYPPDTLPPPARIRGPSEFDILNPLQLPSSSSLPAVDSMNSGRQPRSKITRSYSTNTTSFPTTGPGAGAGPAHQTGRKSEIISPKSADGLLLDI